MKILILIYWFFQMHLKLLIGICAKKIIKTNFDEVQQKLDTVCLTNEEFNRYKHSTCYKRSFSLKYYD